MGIREYPFDGERICVQSYCVSFFFYRNELVRVHELWLRALGMAFKLGEL